MSATWKTVRVFISSTFRDMHAERDHLVREVFPELRERCAKRHLHLVDVDLRWGVTEEDAQRGKALEICLHEIEDCRPFFIGLLGERYGWIPPRYDIPDEERFDSLRNIDPGNSITAMEIYHGVLNNPQMRTHAFFYFRDAAFIDVLPPEKRPDFRAEDDERAAKLRQLKDRIRTSGLPVRENYSHDDLEALGRKVLEDLWGAIQAEHPEEAPDVDLLDAERAYHDFFIETRTGLFIGQRHLLARLHTFAAGDTPGPMVVTGTPGCGKSALLARFVSQFRRMEPDTFVLYHFVGASPSSTDPRQMLRRLCQELARRFGFEEEIPEDFNELRVPFWQFCQGAAEQARLVVVIDALNQLDETHRSHDLGWLPALVPPGLRLIVSSLEGDTLEAARRKYEQRQDMIVTSLRLVDQGFILARQLKAARKSLTSARTYRLWRKQQMARGQPVPPDEDRSQLRYILMGVYCRRHEPTPQQTIQRETANPLYLHLATEELRLFGSFDRLADFIAGLPTDVPGMFRTVLERLEQDHGRELVERSLSLVATGRHGLLESELLDLLARPGEQRFPMALWSRLYRSLAFYLKPRASVGGGEEGLIDFFHRQLAKVVQRRYLAASSTQQARHVELAAYFERKGDPSGDDTWRGKYPRGVSELVNHQIAGRLWAGLEKTLTALAFLEANVEWGRAFQLGNDFASAVTALPEDRPQRRIVKLLQEGLRRDIHFIARHAQDYPQALFQCLWNTCWWYDCDDAAKHYVEPAGGWSPENAPWLRPANQRLCCLLEHWRRLKREDTPDFCWVRSCRPPAMHLGAVQRAVLSGHKSGVASVAFSPDGDRIASGSGGGAYEEPGDNTVRIWDVGSSAELAVLHGHESMVHCVAFSPDGGRIVTGSGPSHDYGESRDNTVRVWDARTGAELAILRGHERGVTSVAYSPAGDRIVSGSWDKTVRVWDAATGTPLAVLRVLRGHPSPVHSVAISPAGDRIVSASDNHPLRVWDIVSGTQAGILCGHERGVTSVAFSPAGDRIVSGSWDDTVRIWDSASGAELAVLRGHKHLVTSVAFSPAGDRIVSGSNDKTVRVWDAASGRELAAFPGHEGEVTGVAFSPRGDCIASGSDDKTVRVWDTTVVAESAVLCGHDERVHNIAFSPRGDRIATASWDQPLVVWDFLSGRRVATLGSQDHKVSSVAFSPDGDRIVSGSYDTTTRIWDAVSGEELAILRGHTEGVRSVAFSPAGDRIVSGSGDKTARVWDPVSGKEIAVLKGHDSDVDSVAFSPGGDRIASGANKTVRVWDAASGATLAVLRGHEPAGAHVAFMVKCLAFSPGGERIAAGSADYTVRVWDAASAAELVMMRGHESGVRDVAFSAFGDRVVSRSFKTVRVWDAASGQELEAIPGIGDVRAIASESLRFPFLALSYDLETVVKRSEDGQPIAWYPLTFEYLVTHPFGRAWASAAHSRLCLITLEGGDTVRARNQPQPPPATPEPKKRPWWKFRR